MLPTSRSDVIQQVLRPVARIRAKDARGSGTIVYSRDGDTYLLTNFHVVGNNVEYKDVWDELLKKDVKKEFWSAVEVDVPKINELGDQMSLITSEAHVVIGNKFQDLALLKLRDDSEYPTAYMYPEGECEHIPLLSDLACCGAAMGEKPVITFGQVNGTNIEIDNYDYDLSSAPSIFGNSGGGVFTPYGDPPVWAYCGIPSRIRVAVIGFGADAITHMGYYIPIRRIYSWLRENFYHFLWTDITKEECDRLREEKREKELAKHSE